MFNKNLDILEKIITVTFIFVAIFVGFKFEFRELANDPQLSIAKNIAFNLDAGSEIEELKDILPTTTDGIFSHQPWIIITNSVGETILNTGVFGSEVPNIPKDYFKNVLPEKFVTWSPDGISHQALVIVQYTNTKNNNSGFVVAGRNFEATDTRNFKISILIIGCYAIVVFIIILFSRLKSDIYRKRKN